MIADGEAAHSRRQLFDRLRQDGVVSREATLTPLLGGVSSDVFRVERGGTTFVVKQALPQLRVPGKWMADTARNDIEQKFLRYVGRFLPQSVPAILAGGDGYFAMEYLGDGFANWKARLLAGQTGVQEAFQAGATLAAIHEHSTNDAQAAQMFEAPRNFYQLRVEPYLLATARRHRRVANVLQSESDRLMAHREALVHGDFSPKNILLGDNRFVLLDCEAASYGDPVFDVAFMLSHLLLKGVYLAPRMEFLPAMASTFCAAYLRARRFEGPSRTALLDRTAWLLPMLLLARVDGRSPVEYLDPPRQDFVRRRAVGALSQDQRPELARFCEQWFCALQAGEATE